MLREGKRETRPLGNREREGWNWRLLQNVQRGLTGEPGKGLDWKEGRAELLL